MDILKFLANRWQHEAVQYPYWKFPTTPVTKAIAGQNYFQLTLSEMALKDDREWFIGWQPAAYVAVRFHFGDTDETINHVAGASLLKDVDMSHLNQGVSVNHPITPLVPYNGGDIEFEAGLVAVKGDSDVKTLLKVLGDFSKALAVPQLSAALAFAEPLADGVADLLGVAGNRRKLRLHDTFNAAGNPLQGGYLVCASDPDGRLDQAKIAIVEGRLHYDGRALTGYDYMVFRIDVPTERDDWESLSSIEEPYLSAISSLESALSEPNADSAKVLLDEANRRLGAAKLAAFRAKELTKVVGRNQVVKALQKKFDDAKLTFGPGAAEVPIARTLSEVMATPISVADAIGLGEMTEWDLLE